MHIITVDYLTNQLFFFLVGWGAEQGVGGFGDEPGIKAQLLNLIRSVRTVMRGLFVCSVNIEVYYLSCPIIDDASPV